MPSEAVRSAAVEKFGKLAEEDSRIIAAFLGGSLAKGTADKFSDIDVYYVIKPEDYLNFHREIRSVLERIGRLVYFDEHNNFGFDLVLFMFQNGVKGELGLGTVEKMRVMHAGPFKVLSDKGKVLQDYSFPFERVLEGEELRKHLEAQFRWYWYWYNILQTSVSRKHFWSALSALDSMRQRVFNILRIVYRVPADARFEDSIPQKLLKELGGTMPRYSPGSIRKSALEMTRILKREARHLLEKNGAEYPSEFEKTVLERS